MTISSKLNIVWICRVANPQINAHVHIVKWTLKNIIKFFLGRSSRLPQDYASWNTNAIREMEKFNDIKLTVITPYSSISGIQQFTINGVDYICFQSDDDNFWSSISMRLWKSIKKDHKKNRKLVKSFIERINPDVVHVIGAENPFYSLCALDVPRDIPCVVALQTLMSVPDFKKNYPTNEKVYQYRTCVEKQVIRRSDYISSSIKTFYDYVKANIKKDSIFLKMTLAVGVEINIKPIKKEYDFVYFANNISKAADDAIEAFALAYKKNPSLTLNISGSYDSAYRYSLEKRMVTLGIENNVFITGSKQTHDEVIEQIKKSRYAILPLKVDFISSTIREAMGCGLPVVTTITVGTPELNKDRESVLLSPIGDYQAMANNMLRLVDDERLAEKVRENALVTVNEKYSNEMFMKIWRKAYYEIIANFKDGTPFSEELILK